MKELLYLTERNTKLFFKDKGMFFSSLITPLILLVLYTTFLAKVYRDIFTSGIGSLSVPEKLINSCVGGHLLSSLLAVSCITVSFCSNMIMVQDKANDAVCDLTITPVKRQSLALGYYISTVAVSLIVCLTTTGIGFIYLACLGRYLTVADLLLTLLDVFLLVMFGTALSSVINFFLSSQGQISAVGTIVSAGYGFICGAYMPLSQFGSGLQRVLSFFPGTYGTSLIRNHLMRSVFDELGAVGFSDEAVTALKDAFDLNLYFFGDRVGSGMMYLILGGGILLLVAVYVLLNIFGSKKKTH